MNTGEKEIAPWIKKLAKELCGGDEQIYIKGGLSKISPCSPPSGWVNADELAKIIAAESTAPAPQHLAHVQRFLVEMYQTMVDPVEEFRGNIGGLCALLLQRAREDRESLHAQVCRCGQGFTVTCPVHGKPTPELEPGEFFITRGDGVQERCRYVPGRAPDKTEKL